MPRRTPAAEQFAALGIPEDDYTDAMRLAVKQKWTGLPVDAKVADLRDQLAALKPTEVETPAQIKTRLILAGAPVVTDAEVDVEHKRLKRNAAVNDWRARNQIQAALDARDAKFAALRAKRKGTTVPNADAPVADAISALAS